MGDASPRSCVRAHCHPERSGESLTPEANKSVRLLREDQPNLPHGSGVGNVGLPTTLRISCRTVYSEHVATGEVMTHEEFVDWLNNEVAGNRVTSRQRDDLLEQKDLFDKQRTLLQQQFRNQIVAYVNGNRLTGGEIHELLNGAKANFPGHMIYFEPIGFDLF